MQCRISILYVTINRYNAILCSTVYFLLRVTAFVHFLHWKVLSIKNIPFCFHGNRRGYLGRNGYPINRLWTGKTDRCGLHIQRFFSVIFFFSNIRALVLKMTHWRKFIYKSVFSFKMVNFYLDSFKIKKIDFEPKAREVYYKLHKINKYWL